MKKKWIAVTPLWDSTKNNVYMQPTYLNSIRDSGAIPILLPLHVEAEDALEILDRCDGLLLTGGPDLDPALYGREKKDTCGPLCEARDALEQVLYRHAVEQDKPVLGICRGNQAINAFEGGTLYQDLPTEFPSDLTHRGEPPYDRVVHYVQLSSALRDLLGVERLGVNSIHHQAICDLGENLEIMARADDGVVEAVRHLHKRFVWAVQWHPEALFESDEYSRKIFKAFIDAC